MLNIGRTSCCGIKAIDWIGGYRSEAQLMRHFASRFANDDAAFMFFSTTGNTKIGDRFTALIKKHKLGSVKKIGRKRNPNSGRMLTMWAWAVNLKNFDRFILKSYGYRRH